MQYLRADSTATVLIGPFVAYDDGVTPVTDFVLNTHPDTAGIMKHDGTSFVNIKSDHTITHRAGGMYTLPLVAGDTDTEGRLEIFIRDDDKVLPVRHEFMVASANVYDSLFALAGTDNLEVKVASDGLDSVSTTAPTGVASDFREMVVQVWRRFFKKATMTSTQLKTYADNGTDVLTTQTLSDDGATQTQEGAS